MHASKKVSDKSPNKGLVVKNNSNNGDLLSSNKEDVGWSAVHCAFAQFDNLEDLILLDSESTESIIF